MTGLVCFWYAQGAQYLKMASNLHGYMEQAPKVLKNLAARCGESSKEQARMGVSLSDTPLATRPCRKLQGILVFLTKGAA